MEKGVALLQDVVNASQSPAVTSQQGLANSSFFVGDQWPEGEAIAEAIGAWFTADSTVRELWERVPENLRGGMRPPQQKR